MLWDLCFCRFLPFYVDKVKDKKSLLAVFTFPEVDWLWNWMPRFQCVVQGSQGFFKDTSFAVLCMVTEYDFQVLTLWDHTTDKFNDYIKTPQHKCKQAAWAERTNSAIATIFTPFQLTSPRVSNSPTWHGEKRYTMSGWEQQW